MAFLPFFYTQKINIVSGDRRLPKHFIFFLLLMISPNNKKKKDKQIIIFRIRTPFEALFSAFTWTFELFSSYMDITIFLCVGLQAWLLGYNNVLVMWISWPLIVIQK